ncbi:MAG: hypothetical protein ACRDRX_04550 [Pseudonocardiaceae bacterium]
MSLYDYEISGIVDAQCLPFYALVMAAMRRADDSNLMLLQAVFPETWREFLARYNAPGGRLDSDPRTQPGDSSDAR